MGRYINPDEPFDDETKEFLRGRARNDEVIENERRFPPDGDAAAHEEAGFMPTKVGYDYETQAEKTEDAIGLPVQRIPTDEHGRPMTAEYGYGDPADFDIDDHTETVDESPVTEPASEPADDSEKKDEPADEEGGIDDDILESVIDLTVEEHLIVEFYSR